MEGIYLYWNFLHKFVQVVSRNFGVRLGIAISLHSAHHHSDLRRSRNLEIEKGFTLQS